jgi:hypothetical protein
MVVEPVVILPAINKRPRSDPGPIGFFRTRLYDGAKASLAYQLRHSSFASKPDPPSHVPSGPVAWPQFQPRLQRPAGQGPPDTDSHAACRRHSDCAPIAADDGGYDFGAANSLTRPTTPSALSRSSVASMSCST